MLHLGFQGYNSHVAGTAPVGTAPLLRQLSGVTSTAQTTTATTNCMDSLLSGVSAPTLPIPTAKTWLSIKCFALPPSVVKKERAHGIRPHYSMKAAIALLGLLCCGCMRVYRPVYVPVKCHIPKLERPSLSSPSLSVNIQALMIYAELLEQDLNFCREGRQQPPNQIKE